MFYLIPAGAQQYTPQEDPLASLQAPQQQYQVGYDAMGNSVVYVAAPASEQATAAPLIAADGSLLQPQVLSAQDLPLLYAASQPGLSPHQHSPAAPHPSEASPQMPSPATTGGGMGPASSLFADAWGEPGYLSAPAAFPSADSAASRVHQQLKLSSPPPPPQIQHAGLPTAAALAPPPPSLASLSGSLPLAPHSTLHTASLDLGAQLGPASTPPLLSTAASQPGPQNNSNTAFLVHQLQQLRVQQQQQEQQKQRQMQVLQLKQQQQQQQGNNLLVQTNQLSAEQQQALSSGQPFQMNSNAQVSRLLSSIQNNSRRADTLKFGGAGARPSQHHPLGKGPMSAPTKPQHSGHKPPHALRAQPPSWAGSNWNPRFVGAPASSAGTGVFLPQVAQQELKAQQQQQQPQQPQTAPTHAHGGPPSADGHHHANSPANHVGSQMAVQSGPPSMASPMDSNLSALSQPLSTHSLYEDP